MVQVFCTSVSCALHDQHRRKSNLARCQLFESRHVVKLSERQSNDVFAECFQYPWLSAECFQYPWLSEAPKVLQGKRWHAANALQVGRSRSWRSDLNDRRQISKGNNLICTRLKELESERRVKEINPWQSEYLRVTTAEFLPGNFQPFRSKSLLGLRLDLL